MDIIGAIGKILFEILALFYGLTHDYGVSIILFAVAIKLILYPLTQQQFKSMKEMQAIQPEMQKLQDRYKDDREALNKAMIDLYRTHKINPMAGCLPVLFQMPILFALWGTIQSYQTKFADATFLWIGPFSEKLARFFPSAAAALESWRGYCDVALSLKRKFPLWGDNLASPDLLLLLLYGASMYLSSKVSSTPSASPDSPQQQTQRTMTVLMPILCTFLFMNFSSAFILYWLVFNVLSILHQHQVMKTPHLPLPQKVDPSAGTAAATEPPRRRTRKRGRRKEAQAP